uniref:Uncharacterized protein n=1 Tax=Rhizobium rhizogenes TaxID=359 RepID=A0A7S4ZRJ0_RHIRH|nr:hypothetical protein pC5.7c_475 [Rhizobium rhizogenes]
MGDVSQGQNEPAEKGMVSENSIWQLRGIGCRKCLVAYRCRIFSMLGSVVPFFWESERMAVGWKLVVHGCPIIAMSQSYHGSWSLSITRRNKAGIC